MTDQLQRKKKKLYACHNGRDENFHDLTCDKHILLKLSSLLEVTVLLQLRTTLFVLQGHHRGKEKDDREPKAFNYLGPFITWLSVY